MLFFLYGPSAHAAYFLLAYYINWAASFFNLCRFRTCFLLQIGTVPPEGTTTWYDKPERVSASGLRLSMFLLSPLAHLLPGMFGLRGFSNSYRAPPYRVVVTYPQFFSALGHFFFVVLTLPSSYMLAGVFRTHPTALVYCLNQVPPRSIRSASYTYCYCLRF